MREKVYLAGPVTGISAGEAFDWRVWAEAQFDEYGIDTLSPTRGEHGLMTNLDVIPDSFEGSIYFTRKHIKSSCFMDIKRSSLVLLNLSGATKVSIGSMIELGYASALRVPVITVMTVNSLHWHNMVREVSDFVVENMEAAILIAVRQLM